MKLTQETTQVIVFSKRFAESQGGRMISTEPVLAALAAVDSPAKDILERNGITMEGICEMISADDMVTSTW